MHDMISLPYLYAAGIEPGAWVRPPPSRPPRRRRARAALGRLLIGAGGVLQRIGRRLSTGAPPGAAIAPQPS